MSDPIRPTATAVASVALTLRSTEEVKNGDLRSRAVRSIIWAWREVGSHEKQPRDHVDRLMDKADNEFTWRELANRPTIEDGFGRGIELLQQAFNSLSGTEGR